MKPVRRTGFLGALYRSQLLAGRPPQRAIEGVATDAAAGAGADGLAADQAV